MEINLGVPVPYKDLRPYGAPAPLVTLFTGQNQPQDKTGYRLEQTQQEQANEDNIVLCCLSHHAFLTYSAS